MPANIHIVYISSTKIYTNWSEDSGGGREEGAPTGRWRMEMNTICINMQVMEISFKTPGELIRKAREAAGLSQIALAERIGWTAGRLSHYETDRREAGLKELATVAKGIGIRLSSLIDQLVRSDKRTKREILDEFLEADITQEEALELIGELTQRVRGPS